MRRSASCWTGSITDLSRRKGTHPNQYHTWSEEFLEAGKRRLKGDTERQAMRGQVDDLRSEKEQLKQVSAELLLDSDLDLE